MKKVSLLLVACITTMLTTVVTATTTTTKSYPIFNVWQNYGNPSFTADAWGETGPFFNKGRLAFNAAGQGYYEILNGKTPKIFKNVNGTWTQMSGVGLPTAVGSLTLAINHTSKTATPYVLYTNNCASRGGVFPICKSLTVAHWSHGKWQSLSETDLPKNVFNYPGLTINEQGIPEIYYTTVIGPTEIAKWVLQYKKNVWLPLGEDVVNNVNFSIEPLFISTINDQPIINHGGIMDKLSQDNTWKRMTSIPETHSNPFSVVAFSNSGTPYAITSHVISAIPPSVEKWNATKKTWESVGTFAASGLVGAEYLAITVPKNGEPVVAFQAYDIDTHVQGIFVFEFQKTQGKWVELASPTKETSISYANLQLSHDNAGHIFVEFDTNHHVTIKEYVCQVGVGLASISN